MNLNKLFEELNLPLTRQTITLIDFDNQHGLDMCTLLSNPLYLELNRIRVEWLKLKTEEDLQGVLEKCLQKNEAIICIPLA